MVFLSKTEFAYQIVKEHLKSTEVFKGPIESYLVQYLQVCFYSEMELCVKSVYSRRLTFNGDEKLSHFVRLTHDNMLGRIKKSDIADMAKHFGPDCKNAFNETLDPADVSYYSSVIVNRHLTSHEDGGTITLPDFEKALKAAERILLSLEQAIK